MSELVPVQLDFQPWPHQQKVLDKLASGIKRACIVWHRRGGKDLTMLAHAVTMAEPRFGHPGASIGTYYILYPTYAQGKKILWDGMDYDGRPYRSYIPSEIIAETNETEMQIKLTCGSVIQIVGTDRYDSIRGTNPLGCVFSEFQDHDPMAWKIIQPILRANGGWAVFIWTPKGYNHAWRLLNSAKQLPDKWFWEIKTIDETCRPDGSPIVTRAEVEEDIRVGLEDEPTARQEYWCSFEGALEGSIFGRQIADARTSDPPRIGVLPWNPNNPVYTGWDIGVRDDTVIWFYQKNGACLDFIDYYKASGEGLPHYVKVLRDKPYTYETTADNKIVAFAPHDIAVREWTHGKSRIEVARSLGMQFRTVQKLAVYDKIDAARRLFPRCRFDEKKCEHGIDALASWTRKWNIEKKEYDKEPEHNWASHPADSFCVVAVAHRDESPKLAARAHTSFNVYDEYEHEFDPHEVI